MPEPLDARLIAAVITLAVLANNLVALLRKLVEAKWERRGGNGIYGALQEIKAQLATIAAKSGCRLDERTVEQLRKFAEDNDRITQEQARMTEQGVFSCQHPDSPFRLKWLPKAHGDAAQ